MAKAERGMLSERDLERIGELRVGTQSARSIAVAESAHQCTKEPFNRWKVRFVDVFQTAMPGSRRGRRGGAGGMRLFKVWMKASSLISDQKECIGYRGSE